MKNNFFENAEKFFEEFSRKMDSLAEGHRKLTESQEKTDEQIRKLKESQKRTDEQIRKLKESQEKADRKHEKTMEMWNGFIGNYSQATEERFYRSLESTMRLGEIKFDEIDRWVQMSSRHSEFDVLLFNGECVGIVEVKSKAHPEEVKSLADKKTARFRKDFPEYSNHKLYFGLASLVTNPALIEKAREEGIFLLTQKGDHLEIVNSEAKVF